MIQLTSKQLRRAARIKDRIDKLHQQLGQLLGDSTAADGVAEPAPRKKRRLSAAGRARIAAAVKARWARERARKK